MKQKERLPEKITAASSIELWRFIFTIGVAIMHFGYYNGFYIAVDFFFMLSGFLLYKSVDTKEAGWTVPQIIRKKIVRLYPEYFAALVVSVLWRLALHAFALPMDVLRTAMDLCMLQIFPPDAVTINGITWYISAMVWCFPLLLLGLKRFPKLYVSLIAPVMSVLIYGFFARNWHHVDFGLVWIGFANGGLIRGFAAMNLGVLAYVVTKKIAPSQWVRHHGDLLALAELLIMATVLVYAVLNRQTIWDFVMVGLLFIGIVIAFCEKGFLYRLCRNPVTAYLGKISYSIYLNQLFVIMLTGRLKISFVPLQLAVLVLLLTGMGAFSHWAVGAIQKEWKGKTRGKHTA